jgi:hypothetical protein
VGRIRLAQARAQLQGLLKLIMNFHIRKGDKFFLIGRLLTFQELLYSTESIKVGR